MTQSVLVIMPSEIFEGTAGKKRALKNVCRELSWVLKIPNYDRLNPKFDLDATRGTIQSVDLVFADLSYERPSCYYELGLAEALGANVFCVAAAGTEIHQTSYRSSVVTFSDVSEFAAIFRAALVSQ